jgi:hypothetical protein
MSDEGKEEHREGQRRSECFGSTIRAVRLQDLAGVIYPFVGLNKDNQEGRKKTSHYYRPERRW